MRTQIDIDYGIWTEFREYCKAKKLNFHGVIENLIKKELEKDNASN